MAADKLGIGIIGANVGYGWGGTAHLPALAVLPEFDCAAVCTTREDTARAAAERYQFRAAYSDYHDLLNDPAVQVVDVCVRVPRHYELVKAALEAGKHVFCEWPLGRTTAEAEELAALAGSKGLRTMVGFQARWSPGVQYLRELVAEGYLGNVVSVTMRQLLPGVLRPRPSASTWSADRNGGVGTLAVFGGHLLDFLCWSLGDFTELSASVSTEFPDLKLSDASGTVRATAPDMVIVTGRLTTGAIVSVQIGSIPWHGGFARLEVYGTEGTIVGTSADRSFNGALQIAGINLAGARRDDAALTDLPAPSRLRWVPAELPEGPALCVGQELARFAQSIQTGTDIGSDFADAARRHRLLDAIQKSSDTRQWVSIPREA